MRRWLLSIAAICAVGVLGLFVFVKGMGVTSRRGPMPGEERLAKSAWRFLIPSDLRTVRNPVPDTPEVLQAGLEHFADHCASCHANNGNGDTAIGRNVFPPAPDLRAARTQSLTDGEIFYAIEQGIPWTAMPAWGTGTDEGTQGSWHLVRFIRHLPSLTPAELTAMERLNPKSAADVAQDKAIEEFLQGKSDGTKPVKEHRHK